MIKYVYLEAVSLVRATAVALFVGLLALSAGPSEAGLAGKLLVDGVEGDTMDPGEASRLTMAFHDESTGTQQVEFELNHGKFMHLIAVSSDLSSFAHLHPQFEPTTGVFIEDVNAVSTDPDDADALSAIQVPGPHFLFSEVKPAGQDPILGRFTVVATGIASAIIPVPEVAGPQGQAVKFFALDGSDAAAGAPYRVTLALDASKHSKLHLAFNIESRTDEGLDPASATHEAIDDLEPWLGMTAHAVMIGFKGSTVQERQFRHMHVGGHDGHGKSHGDREELLFMLHGADVPSHGIYRVWLQAKRAGQVLTFPFTLKL